jgi:glutamate/tyrosine decarboxylase-like PLP-dependent enzyme
VEESFMLPTTDASITTGITEAVQELLPALERFLQYEDEDLAARDYPGWRDVLDEPLPQQGAGAEATLQILRDELIPRGLRIGAPGFAGWVTTTPTVVPAAAELSASIAGSQRYFVQAFNHLEHVGLEWLKQLLGLPSAMQGVFSSGGSVANLIGLSAARQWACEQKGIDAALDGLEGVTKPRVYASQEIHHVVLRAAGVLGMGRRALVALPTDDALRLDVGALSAQLRKDKAEDCTPIAVVASAGTVNTGAVDPLRHILEICREEAVWLHVDGAYGGFGIVDPAVAHLYDGFAEADSIAVDPHKWLAVPLGCGATFVRDSGLLGRTFTLEPAEYLEGSVREVETVHSQFDDFGCPFLDFGVEQSARSRGVTVWAALKEMGAQGFQARVSRHNAYARHLAERVQASPNLELLAPVTLSICCFRYVPADLRGQPGNTEQLNELNRQLVERLHAEHHHVPSSTEIEGVFAIRPCYINPRTGPEEVDDLVQAVERIGAQLWRDAVRQGAEVA